MKVLLDNNGLEIIDDFTYSYKLDSYRRGSVYYKFILECKECGKSYFMRTSYIGKFCSRQCANKSIDIRHKISLSLIGHKRSKEECKLISKRMSKGNVTSLNIPLYDTYAKQLVPIEEVRRNKDNLNFLEVRCTLCGKWFIPTGTLCQQRCQYFKGHVDRENRFYCSDLCKINCSIFNKKKYAVGKNPRPHRNNLNYTNYELKIWHNVVLKRENYICEYCGDIANTAHHTLPKKTHEFYALDPDNGIACCQKCHNKKAHKDLECSYYHLASLVCK